MKFIYNWFFRTSSKRPPLPKIEGAKIRPELLDLKFIAARQKYLKEIDDKASASMRTELPTDEVPDYYKYHQLRLKTAQFYKDLAQKHKLKQTADQLQEEITSGVEESDLVGDQPPEDSGNQNNH